MRTVPGLIPKRLKYSNKISKFIIILSFLGLLSCDDSNVPEVISRSGMGSPMRYDAEPIKIRVKGNYFIVPANCFDSPIETSGYDNGYAIDDSALWTMLWPLLQCRNQENARGYQKTGQSRPRLDILIQGVSKNVDKTKVFEKHYDDRVKAPGAISNAVVTKRAIDDDSLRFTVIGQRAGLPKGDLDFYDIIKEKNRLSYTICSRSYPNRKVGPKVGNCTSYFIYKDLFIDVHYGRGWLSQHGEIEASIIRKLEDFTQKAPVKG